MRANVAKKAPKKSPPKAVAKAPVKSVSKSAPVSKSTPASKPAPVLRSAPVKSKSAGSTARPAPVVKSAKAATLRKPDPARRAAIPEPEPIRPVIMPTPVPTNGKPRKNQAGISPRELEHFRDLLLQKRRELVGDMSQMEREALRSAGGSNLSNLPLHMADMGTDNYEQEFTLGLVEKDRNLLREINSALAKIMDGTYGICEGTGKAISKVRLEAQPWAKYSIEHARKMEKGFIRQ